MSLTERVVRRTFQLLGLSIAPCTSTGPRDHTCQCDGCRQERKTLAMLTDEQRATFYRNVE